MSWSNIAFLLLGFLIGVASVGYAFYRSNQGLFKSLTLMHEANNDMINQPIAAAQEKREEEKPDGDV